MKRGLRIPSLLACALFGADAALADVPIHSTWSSVSGGRWQDAANWSNGVPDGIGDEADIYASSSDFKVALDENITLASLDVRSTWHSTIAGLQSVLTFQAGPGVPTLTVTSRRLKRTRRP